MFFDLLVLLFAGFLGGVLNSIAGGGSFITFPALLLVGVPPISANATNTFSSCSGYLSGAFAFRHELRHHRAELPRFVIISLIGGVAGAWLLLQTPESLFREAIPWLLLLATTLFAFGGWMNQRLKRWAKMHRHAGTAGSALLVVLLLAVCIYGGFFNAGLGIIILSYLALAGHTDINAMNGIKLLISSLVSLIAIVLFAIDGVIAWYEGTVVLLGTLTGGYVAADLSRHLPQSLVRVAVLVAGTVTTLYFFYDIYAR